MPIKWRVVKVSEAMDKVEWGAPAPVVCRQLLQHPQKVQYVMDTYARLTLVPHEE